MAKKIGIVENFYNHADGFKSNQFEAEKNKNNSYKIGSLISPVHGEKIIIDNNFNPSQPKVVDGYYSANHNLKEEKTLVQDIVNNIVTKEINSLKPSKTHKNKNSHVNEIKNSILLNQKQSIPNNIFFPRTNDSNNLTANYEQLKKELKDQKQKLANKVSNEERASKKYKQVNLFDDNKGE